ncbi:MAG: hypothetical protein J7598_06975 [Mitsuaria chitosanitabida]|jgi:hypothetical protein|uniref:hypothetical protein n=1 Tax=Roseateles chitosanitabidus TaxID=65048 RepID=UPI001B01A7F1|nr:hypothetical protein [Roseateles chitosanitabidus]MBO9686337.1 hypothetical protein [Roseateles chitosanitabidus]
MDPARISFDPGAGNAGADPLDAFDVRARADGVERIECIERVERSERVIRIVRAGSRTVGPSRPREARPEVEAEVIDVPWRETTDPAPRHGLVLNGVWVPLAR